MPEVQGLLETTAGSVANIRIPKDRPDLWERFAPENQPVITWGSWQGKEVYSIPRDDESGTFKIGWRKKKLGSPSHNHNHNRNSYSSYMVGRRD